MAPRPEEIFNGLGTWTAARVKPHASSENSPSALDVVEGHDSGVPETVYDDRRAPVPLEHTYPEACWGAVLKMTIRTKSGKNYNGTAFLTRNDTAVTAAHCVYPEDEEPSKIELTSGYGTERAQRRWVDVAAVYSPEEGRQYGRDIALVRLAAPFDGIQPLGVAAISKARGTGFPATILAFASDLNNGATMY